MTTHLHLGACQDGHRDDLGGVALYSIGTWCTESQAYTPQAGLSAPCINVPLPTMRQVIRELRRQHGYGAYRQRDPDGGYDVNDPYVLVERTDGMSEAEVLEAWKR